MVIEVVESKDPSASLRYWLQMTEALAELKELPEEYVALVRDCQSSYCKDSFFLDLTVCSGEPMIV